MVTLLQASFARGEIAPYLYGRVDTAIYQIALRTARNVIIHAYGGVSNRSGGRFVGPVFDHTKKVRLIRFRFKDTDTYMLEFGDLYLRVIRNGAHVTETPTTGVTATASSPIVCTDTGHPYANGDELFMSGFVEMTELNGRRFKVAGATANTYQLVDQVTGVPFNAVGLTPETTGGSAARIYTVVTPYAVADLPDLKYAQTADVMTLTHPSYETRDLTRTDHDAWTLTVTSFEPDQDHPTNLAVAVVGSAGAATYSYRVTATNEETGEESLTALESGSTTGVTATAANPVVCTDTGHPYANGDIIECSGFTEMTELNGRRFTVASTTANTYELAGEDGTSYTAETTGGTVQRTFVTITNGNATLSTTNLNRISWTAVAGALRYIIYKENQGLYGEIGQTEDLSFDDTGITADLTSGPPRARNPFLGDAGNRPAAVGFHEQRRVFGGSNNRPDTSDYTRTGNFGNLTTSSPGQADDAIRATLTGAEVDRIRHYLALDDLLIFTSGAEWRVHSGPDAAFTPDTIQQHRQSEWGSSNIRPILIGRTVLFVQDNRSVVRSFGFQLQTDGYSGTDMTIMASHLVTGEGRKIVDWGAIKSPDPLIAMVREDGEMNAMTFHEEQQVIAFSHWDTPDGQYESVETVQTLPTDAHEDIYYVVRRRMNGNAVRYIERISARVREEDVRDAFYVDAGLSLDSPVTITSTTAANPVTVTTATAHGFADGDEVDIDGIVWEPTIDALFNRIQPKQLNGARFVVRNPTSTTFELENIDTGATIDGSAYNAYVSGGKARKAVNTLTNLHHLEGELVVALADGSVVTTNNLGTPLVVVDGTIVLAEKASRIHVGLRYVADVGLLDVEHVSNRGVETMKAHRVIIPRVGVQLDASAGLFAGRDAFNLDEVKFRAEEDYGEPTRLFSGTKVVPIPSEWGQSGSIFFRQLYPLPMTILAAIPINVQIEDLT